MVWLCCLKQLSILLGLLCDSKSIHFIQKFRYILVLRNKPALHFGVPSFYFAPQKTSYGIELCLSIFLSLFDNVLLEGVAEFNEVGTDEDVHLLLLLGDVCRLDALHTLYQVLHLFKVHLVLHQYLELLSDNHSHFSSQSIIAQVYLFVVVLRLCKVVDYGPHLFCNSPLSELITEFFKFAFVLLLFLSI